LSPYLILTCIGVYFAFLLLVAWLTSRNANSDSYFTGNHVSPWLAVAFGMIGDYLSGVTFISVPGAVLSNNFHYLQVVLGYFAGYFVIAFVLLPVYYRLNLVSIYSYLGLKTGNQAQMTGSFFFLLSRLLGAAGRLFLAASVIQLFVFDSLGIHFSVSVAAIIILMLIYTMKGGIKTLVWTDALQSSFLLLGVVLSIYFIMQQLNFGFSEMVGSISNSSYSAVFDWDFNSRNNFFKNFLGGFFITIAMTGLDQNMMQKNLSCRSLKDAQKNLITFSFVMVLVNIFFLSLGALLYIYAAQTGVDIPVNELTGKPQTDMLFPTLALHHLGVAAGLVFIIGLTAATFNSADSVLTTLTTSFYYDFLKMDKAVNISEQRKVRTRMSIHLGFAVILLLVILLFRMMNNSAIIDTVLTIAGYTYGPLIGLFAYSLFVGRKIDSFMIPVVCIISPIVCYILSANADQWFNGYKFGYELLLINGLLTFLMVSATGRFARNA
jgi:Na+/proline symporter